MILIPAQVIFMSSLFVYLVLLVFVKWTNYSAGVDVPLVLTPGCAPSILLTFIDMVLMKE